MDSDTLIGRLYRQLEEERTRHHTSLALIYNMAEGIVSPSQLMVTQTDNSISWTLTAVSAAELPNEVEVSDEAETPDPELGY